nr:hypothetical protein [Tanacetum cinerariifolium]
MPKNFCTDSWFSSLSSTEDNEASVKADKLLLQLQLPNEVVLLELGVAKNFRCCCSHFLIQCLCLGGPSDQKASSKSKRELKERKQLDPSLQLGLRRGTARVSAMVMVVEIMAMMEISFFLFAVCLDFD